jgi:predicted RNA methylase
MRHHVSVDRSEVTVTRSDGRSSDRFSKESVEGKLDGFLLYLETAPPPELPDAIDHTIRCFQNLRAEIPGTAEGQLASFLALTALRLENLDTPANQLPDLLEKMSVVAPKYQIETEYIDRRVLNPDFARRFYEDLLDGRTGQHRLHLDLTIRHASGELFQAAHLAPAPPSLQVSLFGLPTVRVRPHSLKGVAYTPIGLARSLAEEAINGLDSDRAAALVVLDPACGSGTFLIETVAALARRGWTGPLKVVGYDISATAIASAKFALACAVREHAGMTIEVDLKVVDFLDPEFVPTAADVTIMNPPYMSWADQSKDQRRQLREALGSNYRGRPDLSMAFVDRAVAIAPEGGVIATLLPVGVLAGEYAAKWRSQLANTAPPRLIGSLGDHSLFRFAIVNVAVLVLDKGATPQSTTMLWSSEVAGAASASMRALRRRRDLGIADAATSLESPWAIYGLTSSELLGRPTWLPAPGLLGPALARFTANSPETVSDFFNIKLGVRAGDRDVFVIPTDDFNGLPKVERAGFKPVAEKEDIDGGRISATRYLFVAGEEIDREEELLDHYSVYARRFLLPAKPTLSQRNRIDPSRWWRLAEARNTWRNSTEPRIVSRRWVRNNGYAVDIDGTYAVVQAYAWFPQPALRQDITANRRFGTLADILRLYCIMFSSDIFFRIVREFSTNASGGQVDLQQKYLNLVPLPLLPRALSTDRELASMLDALDPNAFPALAERNAFAARCYGLDVDSL